MTRHLIHHQKDSHMLCLIIPDEIKVALQWSHTTLLNLYLDQADRKIVLERSTNSQLPLLFERKLSKVNPQRPQLMISIPSAVVKYLGLHGKRPIYMLADTEADRVYIYSQWRAPVKATTA